MSYYQREIFEYVRANPGAKVGAITAALGLPGEPRDIRPTRQATQALQKMRRRGQVKLVGGHHGGWEIIEGAKPPKDMRGKTTGSLLALKSHSRTNGLVALAKRGRYQRPVATTAIEQAWGWMPRISPLLTAENESDDNTRGTVRPEETEAA